MMEIYKELLDASKPFEFVDLLGSSYSRRVKKNTYYDNFHRKHDFNQHQYVENIKLSEAEKLKNACSDPLWMVPQTSYDGPVNGLLDIECVSTVAESHTATNNHIASKYDFSRSPSNLLIAEHEDEIVRMIDAYPAVVIEGPTGCGKTTQVPQFVLDNCIQEDKLVNIVVTQPRRIATFSVANRVSSERNWPLGSVVGYKVGLKASISGDTRLTFCTTGVLLQHLITKKNMNDFTHVIVDEVHERDQEMDFLLLVLRKLMRSVSKHVKVILMSATFNSRKFSEYFCYPTTEQILNAPIITIAPEIKFPVEVYHLEDIQRIVQEPPLVFSTDCEARYTSEMCQLVVKLVMCLDKQEEIKMMSERGSVLVFLPGIHDIEDTYEELASLNKGDCQKWKILPLHSAITKEEQMSVFTAVPKGYRKIILSTNISESSITVADVKYVIDSCLTKQFVTNSDTNISCLALNWASKVNCLQRKGRIGRVAPGTVFRLVPKKFYESLLDEQPPEMLRCPLSKLVLMAKVLDCGEPKELLGLAMDPPKLHNIESTILNLKELGGLHLTIDGKVSTTDGDITYLGRIMANLPIDIHLARLIVFGQIFGVYENCLIIAAATYVRNLLSTPFSERLEAYLSKIAWANGSGSDSIALLNAFKNWRLKQQSGYFERNIHGASEEMWARDFYLQLRSIREISDLIEDLDSRLKKIGFIPKKSAKYQKPLTNDEEILLIKVAMAGAFYPNYFISYVKFDDREAVRALSGYDPYSTVYLTNFPLNQPGPIYTQAIKKMLANCSAEMRVTFDGTSKIYVQFPREIEVTKADMSFEVGVHSRSSLAVYKAVKMRLLGQKMELKILPKESAEEVVKKINQQNTTHNVAMLNITRTLNTMSIRDYTVLPLLSSKFIQLKVTHVKNPSKFFIHTFDSQNTLMMSRVHDALNGMNSNLTRVGGELVLGKMYVASMRKREEAKIYMRVSLLAVLPSNTCKVLYVDDGTTLVIKKKYLYELNASHISSGLHRIPYLALECRLSNVGPIDGSWSDEAICYFKDQVQQGLCIGEIYSVVDSVIHMNLLCVEININDELVYMGFACGAAETYRSRENNRIRKNYKDLSPSQIDSYYKEQYSQLNPSGFSKRDPAPPNPVDCTEKVALKGPFSPLEIKVQHMIKGGKYLAANIEQTSINSVLLNDDPLGEHERFLIAGNVHSSQSLSQLIVRDTTLMPTVPGMLPIVSMIFAPKIELRTKPGSAYYSGMLCGLGCDKKTGVPLYPEHDMELVFNTAFTLEDLQEINRLRYWINFALTVDSGELKPNNGPKEIAAYQRQAQGAIFSLLDKERETIEQTHFSNAYKWLKVDKDLLLHPGETSLERNAVLSLHWGVLPEAQGAKELKQMKRFMEKLNNLAMQHKLPKGYVNCMYCRTTLFSIQELREHLQDDMHENVMTQIRELEASVFQEFPLKKL